MQQNSIQNLHTLDFKMFLHKSGFRTILNDFYNLKDTHNPTSRENHGCLLNFNAEYPKLQDPKYSNAKRDLTQFFKAEHYSGVGKK